MHGPAANWQQQRPDDDARDHYFIPPPAAGRYTEPDVQTTASGPGTVAPYAPAGAQRRSRPLELDDDSRDERIRQHADGTWQCDLCKQTCGNCQALAYHRVFCSPRCHACRMMTARRRQKRKQCQDCGPRPSEQDPGWDHTLAQSREEVARITGVSINASGWNPKSRQSARPDSRYGDGHGTAPTASYQPKRQRRAPSSQAQPTRAEIEDRKYPTDDNQRGHRTKRRRVRHQHWAVRSTSRPARHPVALAQVHAGRARPAPTPDQTVGIRPAPGQVQQADRGARVGYPRPQWPPDTPPSRRRIACSTSAPRA
jgi:hypothetical protein